MAFSSGLLGTFILLLQGLLLAAQTTMICPESDYIMGPSGEHCYRYFQSPQTFASAQKVCERDIETIEGTLVIIGSQDEDDFVNQELFGSFGNNEFWIGLNDQDEEGIFRWVDGTTADSLFLNWSPGSTNENTESHDCVKYTVDGWRVHDDGCEVSTLPFACEVEMCESADGEVCIGTEIVCEGADGEVRNGTEVTSESSDSGVDVTVIVAVVMVIVAVVIVIVVIIVIIVVVVILVYMWKFHNDAFYRYVCCCAGRGSKSAVHSLQQENQRLRRELSQHKVSLSGSGRYSQGQFARELSGVPDGCGGVLPTIKQGVALSPTIPEDRPLTFSPTLPQPPPLVPQRGYSRVTPLYCPPSITPATTPSVFGPQHSVTLGAVAATTFPRTKQRAPGAPPPVVVGKPSFPVVQKPGEKQPSEHVCDPVVTAVTMETVVTAVTVETVVTGDSSDSGDSGDSSDSSH